MLGAVLRYAVPDPTGAQLGFGKESGNFENLFLVFYDNHVGLLLRELHQRP